jgi:hypothetical protein
MGPLPAGQSDLTWNFLAPSTLYFGRVNTLTPSGWVASNHISFTTTSCESDFSANSQSVDGNAAGQNQAVLTDVRAAAHPNEGYDRIVFEFDHALPDATIEYISNPTACGSGLPVNVGGQAVLEVRMIAAVAHENGISTIDANRFDGPGGSIIEAAQTCDFEAHVTWALGIDEVASFRVITLAGPTRIVIDVLR